jgi:FkbM family methyltransferase
MRIGWKRGRDEGQRGRNSIVVVGGSRLGQYCLAFLVGVTVSSFYHHHQPHSSSLSTSRRTNEKKEQQEATAVVHRLRRQNTERRQQDVVVDDGWKSIDVFLGQPRDDDKKDDIIVGGGKSQCDQDKLVLALLQEKQRNGYFIDLAANDAIALSNTYQLERNYGWQGVCIEPNPRYWDNLVRLRKCQVAAAVVGSTKKNERVDFFLIEGGRAPSAGILGFDNKVADVGKSKKQGRSVPFYTVPLAEILARYNAPTVIDYLSLDVEGAEYYVMRDFPFDSYAFRILTIERPTQELVDLLYQHRYIYVAANNEHGMETLFLHLDHYYDQQHRGDNDSVIIKTAVESVGWRFGSTKWIDVTGGGGGGTITAQQQRGRLLLTPPKVIGTK